MPLSGSFRQYPLAEVLRIIENGRLTGRLVAGIDGPLAHIYFGGGRWLYGERLGVTLSLAQQLIQAGMVAPQYVEDALGMRYDDLIRVPDVQIAHALIDARLFSYDQLYSWALTDAHDMLSVVAQWVDGEFVFEDDIPAPSDRLVTEFPLSALGASDASQPPAGVSAPGPTPGPEAIINFAEVDLASGGSVQLTRDQWRLLTMVDGRMPLWAIADALLAPEEVILRIAGELVAGDLAVVVGQAPPTVG